MKCFGRVYKIDSDRQGKFVACVSDENTLSMYDTATKKIYKPTKTHDSSCVNVVFQKPINEQISKYICTTACNGTINVYEIPEDKTEDLELKLVKSLKISKEIPVLNEQILQPNW